jgi:hypothetical protein
MMVPGRLALATRIRLVAGAAALFVAAGCTPAQREPERAAPQANGWRSFEGTWSAAGDRRAVETGPGAQASVLDLSGSILLTGERGLGAGFQARVIGFTDGVTSSVGRAVWTDERGDRIFSELRGAPVAAGQRIAGRFTGGTGRWAGITGDYGFEWRYVIDTEGRLQGRAEGLTGRARIVAAAEQP